MKKIFSLLLAALMVASVAVMPVAAEDAKQTNIDVEVLALTTVPTFDGVIDPAEWGDPSYVAEGKDAVSLGASSYSETNTFIMSNGPDAKGTADRLDMKMWFRWDNDYLYVAADVLDDNGYFCENGRDSMWSQDVLQFFVDNKGPNASQALRDTTYDYKTMPFDWDTYERPWSANDGIPNITAGYISSVSKEAYQLYNANEGAMVASAKGDGTLNKATSYDVPGWFMMSIPDYENLAEGEVPRITYEMAIPWMVISYDHEIVIDDTNASKEYGVGKVLGFSMMYQNINSAGFDQTFDATDPYTMSSICWGSGIPGFQHEENKYGKDLGGTEDAIIKADQKYCNGGSNALTLVSKGIDGKEVEGLVTWDSTPYEVEHADRILYGPAGEPNMYDVAEVITGDFYAEFDVAMLDWSVANPEATAAGFVFGSDYVTKEELSENETSSSIADYANHKIYMGYDFSTQTFVVGDWYPSEGFLPQEPVEDNELKAEKGWNRIKESEKFEWAVGDWESETPAEWGTLGLQVKGDTATLYFNGEAVLEYSSPEIVVNEDGTVSGGIRGEGMSVRYGTASKDDPTKVLGQGLIYYVTGERAMDNLIKGHGDDYVFGSKATAKCENLVYNYTCDTTDSVFNVSAFYSNVGTKFPPTVVTCNDAEGVANVAHNIGVLAANETTVMKGCHYCEEIEPTYETNDGTYASHNESIIPPDVKPTPPGPGDLIICDLNGDGKVDFKDTARLIKLCAGYTPEDIGIEGEYDADYNRDGKVDFKDVAPLIRAQAGFKD